MAHAESVARSENVRAIHLEVDRENTALVAPTAAPIGRAPYVATVMIADTLLSRSPGVTDWRSVVELIVLHVYVFHPRSFDSRRERRTTPSAGKRSSKV